MNRFISPNKYIHNAIDKLSGSSQTMVNNYRKHAINMNVRMCNDGYPDARFKATYGKRWNLARRYIATLRKKYEYELNNSKREKL